MMYNSKLNNNNSKSCAYRSHANDEYQDLLELDNEFVLPKRTHNNTIT